MVQSNETPTEEKKERVGLIIVNTGKGKGKTTAALGLALRAVGQGFKVLMVQFIKGTWHYGELDSVKKLNPNFTIMPMGAGFTNMGAREHKEPDPKDVRASANAWNFAKEKIASREYDMIILDEINNSIDYGLIPVDEVIETLKEKPKRLHLVLTGRNAHPKIIELADLVTEMKAIKHPYQKGVKAQRGVEF